MCGRVWIWPLYLDETLGADRLIATSGLVEVWRIIQEAYRTLCCVLVEIGFDGLPVDIWLVG